jgi:tetratricopeptide (TPR) repeat protein
MRGLRSWTAALGVMLAACQNANDGPAYVTTAGGIAIANLDQQIDQRGETAGVEELLLVRSRFLGDYEALDRASRIAEDRCETSDDLLRRARSRSAVHRFADALSDVAAAERAGASRDESAALRASILVATGHASEVIPALEARVARHPGFASRSALAVAYAAIGRVEDADRLFVAALADFDTTLPFPYAWTYFARGMIWTEQAGDSTRGAALYAQALTHVPEFTTANVHLAELEAARGELRSAMARLERVVVSSNEPEALALLGVLHVRAGDRDRGWREISRARQRFESLLARHPLAFADHAAEFYLGPGADAERAWMLAQKNLANRETPQALALAIKAADATGRAAPHSPEGDSHNRRASSAMMSGISSGKNRFAPSTRRTPRNCGKVRASHSGPDGSNIVSPVPQTTRSGD